ncbi:hypothetical protein D3C76_975210 [compost metagenome]
MPHLDSLSLHFHALAYPRVPHRASLRWYPGRHTARIGRVSGQATALRRPVSGSPQGPAPDRGGRIHRIIQPIGRCCRRALATEVPGHPQCCTEESLRTGDRRLPRRPGVAPRIGRAHALQRRRGAAIAHHAVSLHAAGRRTLESHQQRHHRTPSGRHVTAALPTGRGASDADGHGRYDPALRHRTGPTSGRSAGAGTPGDARLPVHPPLPRRQRSHVAFANPIAALPLRLCRGPLHQPGAHLRGNQGRLLRDAGSQFAGLASRAARRQTLARLLLGGIAAGLPRIRGACRHHRARPRQQRRPRARGSPGAHPAVFHLRD